MAESHWSRRRFLSSAGAASAVGLLLPAPARGAQTGDRSSLPPVRAVTRGPKFHWRGYYDKLLFDPNDRFLLANEVKFEHRSPAPEDSVRVGMIDVADGDRWIELGASRAWNWQQGCMLQWIPGSASEVIWNDREGDRFISRILDVNTGKRRQLPHPVYCLSPDGRWGLSTDFRRLNDTRPGYGYCGLPDPNRGRVTTDDSGIWRIDLDSGEARLLISLADAAAVPYPGGFSRDAKHWFNHLLIAPDGGRFIFLHRWRGEAEGRGFATRMFTAGADGRDLFVLDPHGKTSHFIWRDPRSVMAWAWHPSHGNRFYLFTDKTDRVEVVGQDTMTRNGHNTYVPGTDNAWILNDTYPDANRLQHPYLYHVPTGRSVALGGFRSPPEYQGEWRCDTHPCASRSGRWVAFDSPHGGNGRQVYVADIGGIIG